MLSPTPLIRTICIIDDDPNIREIYTIKLKESGFNVIAANDGQQGLALIAEVKPDLALVDINMPKKNGIELVEGVRADKNISRTKIIILTNSDDLDTVKKIENYDTCFYIIKALATPQKVVDMINEALS